MGRKTSTTSKKKSTEPKVVEQPKPTEPAKQVEEPTAPETQEQPKVETQDKAVKVPTPKPVVKEPSTQEPKKQESKKVAPVKKENPVKRLGNEFGKLKTIFDAKKVTRDHARIAANFVTSASIMLTNKDVDRRERIAEMNAIISEISAVKDIEKKAARIVSLWNSDMDTLNAYLAIIAVATAKAHGRAATMSKVGIQARFAGKHLELGQILSECV